MMAWLHGFLLFLGALDVAVLIVVGLVMLFGRGTSSSERCRHFRLDTELHWYYIGEPPVRDAADTWTRCPKDNCWML